jgi:hypothetical protein
MWIVGRNGDFVNEARPQPLDGSDGSQIVRVARNRNGFVKRTDERRNGTTGLKREFMAAKRFRDLKADVSRAQPNMLGVTDAEVDMPNIHVAGNNDAEMILRDKAMRLVARDNANEAQPHPAKRQNLRRIGERGDGRRRSQGAAVVLDIVNVIFKYSTIKSPAVHDAYDSGILKCAN